MKAYLNKAFETTSTQRAIKISAFVGTLLVFINQSDRIIDKDFDGDFAIKVILTYLTPYVVSVVSSVLSSKIREENQASLNRIEESFQRFPEGNPNPVFRINRENKLIYTNPASQELVDTLSLSIGETIPDFLASSIWAATKLDNNEDLPRLQVGLRFFGIGAVLQEGNDWINVYAKDLTAEVVIKRLPDTNPAPVLRINQTGSLLYNNPASQHLMDFLQLQIGEQLPSRLYGGLVDGAEDPESSGVEVDTGTNIYELTAVWVPEFSLFNIYGTNVTAMKALTRFPAKNPNPVLRISQHSGVLLFNNFAAEPICKGLSLSFESPLEQDQRRDLFRSAETGVPFEVSHDEKIYELSVVKIDGFEFYNLYGRDVTANRLLAQLHADNERLLLNILPSAIALRLRGGESKIADHFEEMSVVFADIVGFTKLSSLISPTDLLKILNKVFSAFDLVAEKYGLEKIKTIGDAYMVVGGLNEDPDHISQMARMALDIVSIMEDGSEEWGQPLSIRVGMHIGPAVAGVIGIKKFIYDVWGDTVNLASRLESTSTTGRIQVSEKTKNLLEDQFNFAYRGMVDIKGKGQMETWFLEGEL